MATLTVNTDSPTGTGVVLYYTVTSNDVTTTITLDRVYCGSDSEYADDPGNYEVVLYVTVKVDGTKYVTNQEIRDRQSININRSVSFNKKHSSSNQKLSIEVYGKTIISSASVFPISSSSMYTYVYVPAKTYYTVSYNANGGSNAPSNQAKWYDETLALTSSKPYRTGYVFWHWNTSSTNGGTSYNPEANYTTNAALSLYAIWNPVIYFDANGGSGAPSSQTKTYGQTLTLSSVSPVRNGYQFLGWGTSKSSTSASYQPGGSYTSNNTITLYAVWRKAADAPTIHSMSVVRCNANGVADDVGEYCKVTLRWSVDTTSPGMSNNTGELSANIRIYGTPYGDSSQRSFSTSLSNRTGHTSATSTAIVSGCSTDNQYLVSVRVTNTAIGTGQSSVKYTDRQDILTRAFFTMDFREGGNAVGILSAAPESGLEVGADSQFDEDVTVLGSIVNEYLSVKTETTNANVATPANGYSISSVKARTYGPIVNLNVNVAPSSSVSAGTSATVCTIANAYRPDREVGFANEFGHGYISSGGTVTFYFERATSSHFVVSATYIK